MKRVALLVHSIKWNGYEQSLYELLIRWNRSPAPIVYMTEEGSLSERLRQHGITVRIIKLIDPDERQSVKRDTRRLGLIATLRYARRLSHKLKHDQIECVHASTNTLYTIAYGTIAAKLAHLPIVWHAQQVIGSPCYSRLSSALIRLAFRYLPDGILANSLSSLESLKLPKSRKSEVPIIYPSYTGMYGRMEGIAPDSAYVTVLLVGRLVEWKGQHLLLSAASAFLPDRKVRFWIVASEEHEEPAYRELLQFQIRSNGLKNITLLGYVEDLSSVIHQADILLHTSMGPEPIKRVILLAMAAGIPVIASNIGGPREMIRDDETGILFPPGDIGALRRSIRWMVNHPEERVEMGLKGMVRIKDHFAVEKSLQRIMDYYK